MKKTKGQFIVFEGLDMSGKTTLAGMFVERFPGRRFRYQKGICSPTLIGRLCRIFPSTFLFILESLYLSFKNGIIKKTGISIIGDRCIFSVEAYKPGSDRLFNKVIIYLAERIISPPDMLIYCSVAKEERTRRLVKDKGNQHHMDLIKNPELIDLREKAYEGIFEKFEGKKMMINTTFSSPKESLEEIISFYGNRCT